MIGADNDGGVLESLQELRQLAVHPFEAITLANPALDGIVPLTERHAGVDPWVPPRSHVVVRHVSLGDVQESKHGLARRSIDFAVYEPELLLQRREATRVKELLKVLHQNL